MDIQYSEQLDRLVHFANGVFGRGNARNLLTCLVVLRLLDIEETHHEEGREGVLGLYNDAPPEFRLFLPGEECFRWQHIMAIGNSPDAPRYLAMAGSFLHDLGSRRKGLGCLRAASLFLIERAAPEEIRDILSILNALLGSFGEEPGLDARLYGDLLAKFYESEDKMRGAFRPSKALCRAMAELVRPEPGDVIADPNCCFEGPFLAVLDYLRRARANSQQQAATDREKLDDSPASDVCSSEEWAHISKDMFHGFVLDTGNLLPASLCLMLQGIRGETIHYGDALSNTFKEEYPKLCREAFDCVLSVPYFGRKEQGTAVELLKQIKTKETTILFLLRILQMLKASGRAVVLVPAQFTFRASYDYTELRKMLIDNKWLEGIIFLPQNMFRPTASVKTCLVVINKKKPHNNVFFYSIECDTPTRGNAEQLDKEFAAMITAWRKRDSLDASERSGNVFLVPYEEIINKNYLLAVEAYQKRVYDSDPGEDPLQLLASLEKMAQESLKEIKSIQELFK